MSNSLAFFSIPTFAISPFFHPQYVRAHHMLMIENIKVILIAKGVCTGVIIHGWSLDRLESVWL
ncbi:MAG: hypothetical protein H2B00_06615 [Nitrosopumilaceae archaeon]|jgi:hypothetical protein|nr:hypothetical protein [Nitrosopumilaceae archaeon]NCF22363.1 hypothetical protein [Nitrosopumilaceae archaeon]